MSRTADEAMGTYRVSLEKEQLIFSAAHFITFNGEICERIHGHNYRVRCEVTGPLDENEYVIDFIALRDSLLELTQALDHRVLLPDGTGLIGVEVSESEVTARFEQRRWVFPREDAVVLPMPNTTAERLAGYLLLRLVEKLTERGLAVPELLRVGVDENEGQWGECQMSGAQAASLLASGAAGAD